MSVQINFRQTVPTLKDGDLVIVESRAILAYLANKYGKDGDDSLYPNEVSVRARVDDMLHFDGSTFTPLLADTVVGTDKYIVYVPIFAKYIVDTITISIRG